MASLGRGAKANVGQPAWRGSVKERKFHELELDQKGTRVAWSRYHFELACGWRYVGRCVAENVSSSLK
jgi:hypothetical protein